MQFGDPRLPERFWNKVQPEPMSGCWLWAGSSRSRGYGSLWLDQTMQLAHRISFSVENEVPSGMVVDHKCRVHCCVNPDHLRAITGKENTLIGVGPSALNAQKAMCSNGHDLSGDNLLQQKGPRPRRVCRACRRASCKAYKARLLASRRALTASDGLTGRAPRARNGANSSDRQDQKQDSKDSAHAGSMAAAGRTDQIVFQCGCGVALTRLDASTKNRLCVACRRARKIKSMADRRAKRIASGQCGRCGAEPAPGRRECGRCLEITRKRQNGRVRTAANPIRMRGEP